MVLRTIALMTALLACTGCAPSASSLSSLEMPQNKGNVLDAMLQIPQPNLPQLKAPAGVLPTPPLTDAIDPSHLPGIGKLHSLPSRNAAPEHLLPHSPAEFASELGTAVHAKPNTLPQMPQGETGLSTEPQLSPFGKTQVLSGSEIQREMLTLPSGGAMLPLGKQIPASPAESMLVPGK